MTNQENKSEPAAERRLTLFILLSAMILLTHLWLQNQNRPPEDAKKAKDKQTAEKSDGDSDKKQPELTAPGGDEKKTEPGKTAESDPVAKTETPSEKRKLTQAAPRWVSLGSIDPASPYRMLATFNSRGAALERVELSSHRYHDLEDDRGYLGHLALALTGKGSGLTIQAVGAGTPAALAKPTDASAPTGLQPGDILMSIDGNSLTQVDDFNKSLTNKRPADEVKLVVVRGSKTLDYVATLRHRPLELMRPEAITGKQDPLSLLLTLESIGSGKQAVSIDAGEREIGKIVSLFEEPWELQKQTESELEFRFVLDETELKKLGISGELEIIKRFQLAKTPSDMIATEPAFKSYHLDMDIEFKWNGKEPQQVAYRLYGPNGLPLEGWWYSNKVHPKMFAGAGARDIVLRRDTYGHELKGGPEIYSNAKKKPETPTLPLFSENDRAESRAFRYIGVDSQYFSSFLLPAEKQTATPAFKRAVARPLCEVTELPKGWEKTLNVSFQLSSEPKTILPGESLKQNFQVFIGPKDRDLLAQYNIEPAVEFGWWGWVCKPMSRILALFVWISRNFGIAIVMLTILVRSCMLPVTLKMTRNAQKMQELAPEIKKIRDKYKNDLQKQSQAQQELFRKHNVNMYSGCLLVFLQLPIFAGLYRLLSVDINLRQAPLVPGWEWCSNLAGPDRLWYWRDYVPGFIGNETGYFGPYLNVLPIITVTLFLINQRIMTPPATDDQTKMQQQIMTFMMIFFAVMFFKVPSGLCLYFIASSVWTLCEHRILKKGKMAAATPAKA